MDKHDASLHDASIVDLSELRAQIDEFEQDCEDLKSEQRRYTKEVHRLSGLYQTLDDQRIALNKKLRALRDATNNLIEAQPLERRVLQPPVWGTIRDELINFLRKS